MAIPFLNRSLGSEAFGSFAVAQAVALIAALLVDYGFSLSGSRSAAVAELAGHSPSQIYSNLQNARALLGFAAVVLTTLVICGLGFPVGKSILFATAIPAVIGSFLQPVWFFQGRGLFQWLAISNTVSKGLFLCGAIFLIKGPGDLQLLAVMYGGSFVLGGLLLQFGLRCEGIVWAVKLFSKESLPPLRENFPSFMALLLLSGHTQFIIVAIGFLSGLPASGALLAADRLVRGLAGLTSPLVSTAFPQLSRLSVSAPDEARRMRWHILGALFTWGAVCSAALYIFSHELALKWYPANPQYFTQILSILAPIPMVAGFGVVFGGLGLIV
jgi:O-antigen/teichoic acid export membrane protein